RPAGQRGQEGLFLVAHDVVDALEVASDLRIRRSHRVAHHGGELAEHRLVHTQQPHRPDDAPQQPTQYVAASLVAGRDTVTDQHDAGACVVGDHPEPHVIGVVLTVATAGDLLRLGDHRAHQVRLVDVGDALQQVGDALDPHPGVDVLLRQRTEHRATLLRADLTAQLLHEDQVPDLQVAVLVHHGTALPAVVRTAVVVDLRARAARAGHTHVPVVVRGGAVLDPVLRDAGDLAPQRRCLGIVLVDRHPQPALVEPVATVGLRLGDQVPRVLDGAFLEVVAEREVARHLEERVVPGGLADLVDVAGTHALLHAGRARVRRRGLAQEV